MIIINLFNLFAKIELDDKGFKKGVDNASKDGKGLASTLGGIGQGIGTVATGIVKAIGTTSVAIGTLAGLSIKQYAEYEQLVGGVETLFKDSSNLVMEYSKTAYKTAGMSANQYMTTITGFSASLLQGLGGDTVKASEIGNKAVTDMSDNANKLGTDIGMLQNSYQGFAKQNYTMLDNLKLGYGGTKEEMARLLVEAEKVSGITYDMNNFSDVIEAIHVIQTEIGITGTTSLEASTTIQGSLNTMKGAWANLLTGMADDTQNFDGLIDNLIESVGTFGGNILPRIKTALEGVSELIVRLGAELPNIVTTFLPMIVNSGIDVIKSLIQGISQSLPSIVTSALDIIMSLINGIIEILPMLLQVGLQAIITLGQGIASNLPALIPAIVNLIISMADMIISNLPTIFATAIDIIFALVDGILDALPTLIEEVPRIINEFSNKIYEQLPKILMAGIEILMKIIEGLIKTIPVLVANLPQIIMAIINAFTLINWWKLGKDLVVNIGKGLVSMVKNLGTSAKELAGNALTSLKSIFTWDNLKRIGTNLVTWLIEGISSLRSKAITMVKDLGSSIINGVKSILTWDSLKNIGSNLIQGLWNGISNMGGWIMSKIGGFASSIIGGIKDFFGINSPSTVFRDEVGIYLAQGIGVGFDEEMQDVNKDIEHSLQYDYNASIEADKKHKTNDSNMLGAIYNLLRTIADNGINIDGREVARALSPYQEELNDYNTRNPLFI